MSWMNPRTIGLSLMIFGIGILGMAAYDGYQMVLDTRPAITLARDGEPGPPPECGEGHVAVVLTSPSPGQPPFWECVAGAAATPFVPPPEPSCEADETKVMVMISPVVAQFFCAKTNAIRPPPDRGGAE